MKKRLVMMGLLCFMILYQAFHELTIFYDMEAKQNEETIVPQVNLNINSLIYKNDTHVDLINSRGSTVSYLPDNVTECKSNCIPLTIKINEIPSRYKTECILNNAVGFKALGSSDSSCEY
ncbi:hypothetical protein ACERII_21210 [Evansella sp. AB-rgal1]|uniref:hypothetical protein n=1 Tax=Evansella sp. AB-rgal1 TaxID=3242696 RepID=UPI00359F06BC